MNTFALWIGVLIGSVFVLGYTPDLLKSLRTNKWNKVEARVLRAGYDTVDRSGGGLDYCPWLVYEYVVNQRLYQSDRVFLGRSSFFYKSDADEHVKKYSAGYLLDIWVDPQNLHDTVMAPGFNWGYFVAVIFGFTTLSLAGYGLFA